MTNSDRLQEIRERVQLTRETYPNNGTILLLGSDLDGLLQLVTEQQREIETLLVRRQHLEDEVDRLSRANGNLREEIEGMQAAFQTKGYRKQERPM